MVEPLNSDWIDPPWNYESDTENELELLTSDRTETLKQGGVFIGNGWDKLEIDESIPADLRKYSNSLYDTIRECLFIVPESRISVEELVEATQIGLNAARSASETHKPAPSGGYPVYREPRLSTRWYSGHPVPVRQGDDERPVIEAQEPETSRNLETEAEEQDVTGSDDGIPPIELYCPFPFLPSSEQEQQDTEDQGVHVNNSKQKMAPQSSSVDQLIGDTGQLRLREQTEFPKHRSRDKISKSSTKSKSADPAKRHSSKSQK